MTTVAVKDSKQKLMQAFQQMLPENKKLESKVAIKQDEVEKAKSQVKNKCLVALLRRSCNYLSTNNYNLRFEVFELVFLIQSYAVFLRC